MDSEDKKIKKFKLSDILAYFQMPRMHSSSGHCCLCVVGLFMFLAGIIMIAIGVCLILNYGLFDSKLLPEEFQSDDGKRIVGIILTSCGFVASLISVLVSSYYLCSRNKPPAVEPLDLSQIPNTARKTSNERRPTPDLKVAANKQNGSSGMHSTQMSQSHIRKAKRKRHKMNLKSNKKRLEGIQETDCISRRQSEVDMATLRNALEEELQNTARSDTVDYSESVQNENAQLNKETVFQTSNEDDDVFVKDDESADINSEDASASERSVPNCILVQEDNSVLGLTKDGTGSSSESGYTDSVITDKVELDQQMNSLLD